MARFDYLSEKIRAAPFQDAPFRHDYIEDYFEPDDLAEILATRDLTLPVASCDEELFERLFEAGYKIINFPGCIEDKDEYLSWHSSRVSTFKHHTACEGFGVTLRLARPQSKTLRTLTKFMFGGAFNAALAEKFDIDFGRCTIDGGIQKYLDGYEISPHPDIRKKALTYMVNINPTENSEAIEHHTHYLKLKPAYQYVDALWQNHPEIDRCWVPWHWCDSLKEQRKNNTIVIFSPANDTMHGVKAQYDHLKGQRTQLYGNLWYSRATKLAKPRWEDLEANPAMYTS
jgi:hypothetical protein